MNKNPERVLVKCTASGIYAEYGRVAIHFGHRYFCRDCDTSLPSNEGNDNRFCVCCGRLLLDPEEDEKFTIFNHTLDEAEAFFREFCARAGAQPRY